MAVRGGGGAYSKRNRVLEKERRRDQGQHGQHDSKPCRGRAFTLSMETTQRQRAMENRKLIILAAEEERRQRILSERRQFQREATERFRLATERCKAAAGENALTTLPSAGITASLPSKPSSAKPAAPPRSGDWESNLIAARCNSARRILSGRDRELFRTPNKLQFPPLNPQKSLSNNEGAVPIRRGVHNGLSRVVENEKRIPSSGTPITHSAIKPQPLSAVGGRSQIPRIPSATNLTSCPEKAYSGFRKKSSKLYSSSLGSLVDVSSQEKALPNPVPLESTEKPKHRVRFSIDGYEELMTVRANRKPLSSIMKTTPKPPPPPPPPSLPKPKPVLAPPMVPAKDDDSWYSLTPSEAGSECEDEDKDKEKDKIKSVQPETPSVPDDKRKAKEKPSSFGHKEAKEEEEEEEDSDESSVETIFSESDIERGEEESESEEEEEEEEQKDEDKVFVRPWRIISEEKAREYRKAERLRREAAGESPVTPDSLNSSIDLDGPRPKRNYLLEALRLLSATSTESSSGSSKNDLASFLPPPVPPEPAGILKKKTENSKALEKEATNNFYKSLLEVKAQPESTLSTMGTEIPKKVRFDDEVLSAPIKVVQPLLNTSLLPIWKYPEEEEPVNPLARGILSRTYKRSSSSVIHVESPPRNPTADKPELLSFSSSNGASESYRTNGKTKVDKRENSSSSWNDPAPEKPKYVVDAEEPDMEKMWQDLENCMMREEKKPPPPKMPKYVSIKQRYIAGLQPRIQINTNGPTKRSTFNGQPQVVARYAREMLGIYPETEAANRMPSNKSTKHKNNGTSKIPVPPKDPPPRRKAPHRPMTKYSLEEKKIKQSLEKIDKKIQGFPGSASLLGSRGCSSIYRVKLPSPNPPKPPKSYFSEHRRTNYGKTLYNPSLEDDYF